MVLQANADKVVSYTMGVNGVINDTDKELRQAEKEGYRVVDVLSTSAATSSFVVVTVALTKVGSGMYRGAHEK